jgi:hypothetical protein
VTCAWLILPSSSLPWYYAPNNIIKIILYKSLYHEKTPQHLVHAGKEPFLVSESDFLNDLNSFPFHISENRVFLTFPKLKLKHLVDTPTSPFENI